MTSHLRASTISRTTLLVTHVISDLFGQLMVSFITNFSKRLLFIITAISVSSSVVPLTILTCIQRHTPLAILKYLRIKCLMRHRRTERITIYARHLSAQRRCHANSTCEDCLTFGAEGSRVSFHCTLASSACRGIHFIRII